MADAEEIFRSTLHKVAKENNIHNYDLTIKPLSTKGANFSSHLFLAKIKRSEDIDIFGKVAACGEKIRKQFLSTLYYSERYFYNTLYKIYQDLQDKRELTKEERLRLPKFYGCNANLYEETIILEDLGSQGFTLYDRMNSIDWEYASAAVSQLAKFHALSMAYMKDNKEAFDKDLEKLISDRSAIDENWKAIRDNSLKPALNSVSEDHKDKLMRFIETNYETNPYFTFIAANKIRVIIHGDYRPSNLMYRTLEDGKVELIPVDFQTLRSGSPLLDLLYFIYTGSDEEFRRLHYQQLIDHYYSELSAAMDRLGIDPETYSRKDFDDDLESKKLFGIFVVIFVLPVVTVETENAPQMKEDTELQTFTVTKASNLYKERLNGVINEYIRLGVLT